MLHALRTLFATGLLVGFSLAPAYAADSAKEESPLHAQLLLKPQNTAGGGTVEATVTMDLAKDYHAYLERFKIRVSSPDGLKMGDSKITPITKFMDTVSKSEKQGIEGHAVLTATIEIPEAFAVGQTPVHLALTYQACTKDHCLFPKTLDIENSLNIVASGEDLRLQPKTAKSEPMVAADFHSALDRGLLSALLFVFVVGFLTSLTPCIYPMIPITLAILGARSAGQSRARGFSLSLMYVLGIAVTYSSLGVFAAATGSLFGSALSNVWVVSTIALIFIVMGLGMYGLFEIQVPAFVRNRFGNGPASSGFGSAFVTGIVAGVVASPCVGPVLVSLLAYIAQTQNRLLGFIFLFTFAMGMGILFIVLGTFSRLLQYVPKSGPWMNAVKFIFGTTMIAMAFYYIKPLYPHWLFIGLLGIALVMLASFYGAFDRHASSATAFARIKVGLLLSLFLLGAALIVAAGLNCAGFISLSASTAATSQAIEPSVNKLDWQKFSDEKLHAALAAHKPVIIDFGADWCAACSELEEKTFSQPEIAQASHDFVLLTVDATNETPELTTLKKEFAIVGLPTIVFFDKNGRRRDDDLRLTGFETSPEFLKRMQKALL